jgi:hypothetical protein
MAGGDDFRVTCRICNKPLELGTDTTTDENGEAVHETCYAEQIMNAAHNPPATPAAD